MRVAFVAPFFGPQAAGGAESECRQTALRLARSGVDVEVFTTCALDLQHGWQVAWHKQGTTTDDGLPVHRFPAERIPENVFGWLNTRLLEGRILSAAEEQQFIAMHVSSTGLLRALARAEPRFEWICFIPYLFGTTFHGTRLSPRKSILIPCLHDESYARMSLMRGLFQRVRRIVFHTAAEREIARRLYGDLGGRDLLIGEGIETSFASDGARFRQRYGLEGPFLLYAGRKDATKNVDLLIRYHAQYHRGRRNGLRLVLIGAGSLRIPADCADAIVDLGFVPAQDKLDAYAAASGLCQPSVNESFSIVMMEAWICGTPCLVHGNCAVTREHVTTSGGGLYFTSYAEYEQCVAFLAGNRDVARRMGEAGRQYVLSRFTWERIVRRYREEVFAPAGEGSSEPRGPAEG